MPDAVVGYPHSCFFCSFSDESTIMYRIDQQWVCWDCIDQIVTYEIQALPRESGELTQKALNPNSGH